MARQDEIKERDARVIRFIRVVTETADRLNTKDTTLVGLGFIFCLLWEVIEKLGHNSSGIAAELRSTREKWSWKEGDK